MAISPVPFVDFCVRTRAAEEAQLASAGISGPAAELLLKEGAPARHADRVLVTLCTALAGALVAPDDGDEDRASYWKLAFEAASWAVEGANGSSPLGCGAAGWTEAWGLLRLDLDGVGGHANAEGAASARHPCFHQLGKGRKAATDGRAYQSAAELALALAEKVLTLQGRLGLRLEPRELLASDGKEGPQRLVLAVVWGGQGQGSEAWQGLVGRQDTLWWKAQAARALLAARATKNWASVVSWARFFNQLAAESEAAHGEAKGAVGEHGSDGSDGSGEK